MIETKQAGRADWLRYADAPDGEVLVQVFSCMTGVITGMSTAKQDRTGRITITYTDGSTESAECPDVELHHPDTGEVAILDAVQGQRKAAR